WRQDVVLSPFAPGEIVVPGPHFIVVDAATGSQTPVRPPALSLHVSSRLPQGEKPEALAPKVDRSVRIPSRGPWFWGSVALAALLVAALVAWLVKRRRKKAEAAEVAPPPLPPGEELLATLDRLARAVATLGDDPRDFYSDMTHALKRYLERRLEQPVLEWTTFETLRRMRDLGYELPREIGLSELLSSADRVKFGKGRSTRREADEHLKRARLVHDHLEARLAPPPKAQEDGKGKKA
ncbi:MAG TPA: hypothetical protein VGR00_06500, partial [Thermoanaerobaculia bacterium]|nr:hypothetical protein [Thermoanaerobaculia bacterium]